MPASPFRGSWLLPLCLAACAAPPLSAQTAAATAKPAAAAPAAKPADESKDRPPLPPDAHVQQSITLAGAKLTYTVTVGSLPVRDAEGKTTGELVYTAYTVPGADRPVTFAVNGGPGASSVYLNFGATEPDIEYLSRSIYDWLVRNDRLGSRKYLVGESYGGFRVPRLTYFLQSQLGVAMNGIVLVSPYLNPTLEDNGDLSPIPWMVTLPSITAANLERQ